MAAGAHAQDYQELLDEAASLLDAAVGVDGQLTATALEDLIRRVDDPRFVGPLGHMLLHLVRSRRAVIVVR